MNEDRTDEPATEPSRPASADKPSAAPRHLDAYIDDIDTMLVHMRDRGIGIPEELDARLAQLFGDDDGSLLGSAALRLDAALDVHRRLLPLVAPATPKTLRASKNTLTSNVPLTLIGTLGALGFVLLVVGTVAASSPISVWLGAEALTLLGAATLGSAFYALASASKYLRKGVYDPRFSRTYVIRFGLGVFSGFILGEFGPTLLSFVDAEGELLAVGPAVLALIGGFSAEAVGQLLQRISDTLVAAIRGPASERAEADADKRVLASKSKVAADLQDALTNPEELGDRIKQIAAALLRSG